MEAKAGAVFGVSALEAAVTAGGHYLADTYVSSFEKSSSEKLTNLALSAGSSLASRTATEVIIPYVTKASAMSADASRRYLQPLVSGALYVAGAMLLKTDKSTMVQQFLIQVGANAAASYVSEPIYQMATGTKPKGIGQM